MNKMIKRYIYDVTRRLSEKERSEVSRELEVCITDMLPDNPKEQDVVDTLAKLGAPRLLAEQYRQTPRYLISPAVFELYISVLKTVTLIVAGVFACLGAITVSPPDSLGDIIGSAANAALSGALQAVFWVTFGFVISERFRSESRPWTINDLPPEPDQTEAKIPRSSAIAGVILSIFFTTWLIVMIVYNEWIFVFVSGSEITIPFSRAALDRSIPYILLLGSMNLLLNILKLFWARWNISLCIANILTNIVWISVAIYILHWTDLLSNDFIAFANAISKDYQHILPGGMANFFSASFIIAGIIDIGESFRKTWKGLKA